MGGRFLWRRLAGWATLGALICVIGASSVAGAAPPGNNGTVKVHDGAGEAEPIRRNEPHVCDFHLHAFGFDGHQAVEWSIKSWPPTGDGTTVLSGSTVLDEGGDGRDPASGTYGLPDGHYKLFWRAQGAPGGPKHKVFWVSCGEDTTATTTVANDTTTTVAQQDTTTTVAQQGTSTTVAQQDTKTTVAHQETSTTVAAAVKSAQVTGTSAPAAGVGSALVTQQETLPFTGWEAGWLLRLGLALITVGGLLAVAARRRQRAIDPGDV